MLLKDLFEQDDSKEQSLADKIAVARKNVGKLVHLWSSWGDFRIIMPEYKGKLIDTEDYQSCTLLKDHIDVRILFSNRDGIDVEFHPYSLMPDSTHAARFLTDGGTIRYEQIWEMTPTFDSNQGIMKELLTRVAKDSHKDLSEYKFLIDSARKQGFSSKDLDKLEAALTKSLTK